MEHGPGKRHRALAIRRRSRSSYLCASSGCTPFEMTWWSTRYGLGDHTRGRNLLWSALFGYDTDPKYVATAKRRVSEELERQAPAVIPRLAGGSTMTGRPLSEKPGHDAQAEVPKIEKQHELWPRTLSSPPASP